MKRLILAGVIAGMGFTSLAACGGAKATTVVAKNPTLPPANPIAARKMAQAVAIAKDPGGAERALVLLREAIGIDPNLWEARYDLGIILADSNDLASAEPALDAAAKLAPAQEEVAVALAEVRRRRDSHKLAADGLGDFLKTRSDAIDARTLYVTALRDSGQVDEAIRQGRLVLTRKPGNAVALAELGLCHLAKTEYDTGELLIKQALDVNPKSSVAHRALGLLQLAKGDDALAFQSFQKASQEDPKDTTARLNMGSVLLRAGAYAKAEEQYRAILAIAKDDSAARIGLAASLRPQGDAKNQKPWEEAKNALDQVVTREPHNLSALFNLGLLHAEFLKNPGEAKKLFDRYLADAPEAHPGRKEAERLVKTLSDGKAADPKAADPKAAKPAGAP